VLPVDHVVMRRLSVTSRILYGCAAVVCAFEIYHEHGSLGLGILLIITAVLIEVVLFLQRKRTSDGEPHKRSSATG
jgi:hypothetical protein